MPDAPLPTTPPKRLRRAAYGITAVLAVILVAGTATRLMARQDLRAATNDGVVQSVSVTRPSQGEADTLVLPGRLQAWAEAPVYARTSGYLRGWYVDIGTPVKTGQLLAEIDAPEVDQQLVAANAALATAEAQRDLAAVTSKRWERLVGENAVSQQEADEKRGDFAAREAMRNEAQANVQRLRALTGFRRIVAPFDGVVTSRATDVGALVTAGSGAAEPLFTIADDRRLRLYVSLPENQSAMLRPGGSATFTVPDPAGDRPSARSLPTTLGRRRSAHRVDARLQLTVDNSGRNALRPGGYAARGAASRRDRGRRARSAMPASALLFRQRGRGRRRRGRGDHGLDPFRRDCP
jgi:RND family efflux transporter MFP subunit